MARGRGRSATISVVRREDGAVCEDEGPTHFSEAVGPAGPRRRNLVGREAAGERAAAAGRAGPRQSVGLRREAEPQRQDAVAGRALPFHSIRGSDGLGGAARARVHEPKSCREIGAAEGAFSSVLHGGEGLTLWQIIHEN